jgi:hypothetical protein
VSLAAGGYGIGRSTQTLVDRHNHKQSIGLDNAESRNCWLNIGGSVIGVAAGGATAATAKMVQVGSLTTAGHTALKTVTAGSSFVNAVGVVNGLADIIQEAVNEGNVSALTVFQFTASMLFFTNSVLSTHQAYALMKSIEKNGTGPDEILSVMNQMLKRVKNPGNSVTAVTEVANFTNLSGYVIGSSPLLTMHIVHQTICDISKYVCRVLAEVTKYLLKGLTTVSTYVMEVSRVLDGWWKVWNEEIADVINKIHRANQGQRVLEDTQPGQMKATASTVIAGRNSLANCDTAVRPEPSEDNSIGGIPLRNGRNSFFDETRTGLSYEDEIINIHAKFVNLQICRNPADFPRYMTFVCKFVQSEFEKEMLNYKEMWGIVTKFNPNAKVEGFHRVWNFWKSKESFLSESTKTVYR